ncbi:hypothetical protein EST38_g6027 [Candolleomyces aberdarensis]|uniref:Glycosyltransferase family 8 protein n=1 Tax=Candolleomyces aberdarensis TaxID=2316362 RepID=A0A4Q2DM23_9AGAR|nr:hypothetical protein EST38_g6027 [Candolleomyces aberdarensis]
MSISTAEHYDFTPTQDWFSHNIPHWKSLFPHIRTESYYVKGNGARIMEIGSWEGRSAVFLANELCKARAPTHAPPAPPSTSVSSTPAHAHSEVVCIDHFDLFKSEAGKERYKRINHNLSLTNENFRIIPEFSVTGLMRLLNEAVVAEDQEPLVEQGFDWTYIDGSHRSDDTLLDGELAWRLTRKGGLMIFDDYLWNVEPETSIEHPKRGIDGFLALHRGEYERLSGKEGLGGDKGEGKEYQVVLRKTVDMRIGYLLPSNYDTVSNSSKNDGSNILTSSAFGYGINIGVACDSAYAMPTSVLLSTLIEHTPGRKISIYLLDCGLSELDKIRIQQSIPSSSSNITLNFLTLPSDSLTARLGSSVWAKVDLIKVAPVERILYLDGDILVRSDVWSLWDIDLEGNPIGAALDVGNPTGHAGYTTTPEGSGKYFNAGVLLMDLTKHRAEFDELVAQCHAKKDSKYADQDALNAHFAGKWKELNLQWNAQGLGTYVNYEAAGRHWVDRQSMFNPSIVHFTGPVHPSLVEVLNPYVQPYTSKPWGYAGSPGHPYAKEWVAAVGKTSWLEFYEGDWKDLCEETKKRVAEEALEKFHAELEV